MADPRIIELRQHLRRKFPAAHSRSAGFQPISSESTNSPSLPAPPPPRDPVASALLDAPPTPIFTSTFDVGRSMFDVHPLPPGTITEIVPAGAASGLSLVIAALLGEPPAPISPSTFDVGRSMFDVHPPLVLIDARDCFDPDSFPPAQCARLLWVRCHETRDAIEAADLLLRDGNLPLVLLDLASLPERELRRVHRSTWHRLRQLAADRHSSLIVLAPTPTVPCAALRLTLGGQLTLDHLDLSRPEALLHLRSESQRLRHAQ